MLIKRMKERTKDRKQNDEIDFIQEENKKIIGEDINLNHVQMNEETFD